MPGILARFFLQKKCIKCHNVLEMFEHVQNWFWKTSQFIWVAPNRSHQTCSGLWAPAPGHILMPAHVPTFTIPFQFLNTFKLKQGLSGENNHELNSCLQISYRNSRLNWISRLQSIFLPDCEKVYFLRSAQNISLNGDLGMAIPCLRPSPRTVDKP
jgi:hypothetical protein